MSNETKPSDQRKKVLPPGLEQVKFDEYKKVRDMELEKRNKKKQVARTMDKIVQIVMTIAAIPFVLFLLYMVYVFLSGSEKGIKP